MSSFRKYLSKFEEKDTKVLGISCDSRASQAAYNLSLGPSTAYPIQLLSDFHPHGEMTRTYGLFNEKNGASFRAVVIIDKEGIIRFKRRYTSVVAPGDTGQGVVESELDAADILAEVEKIQN